MNEFDTENVSKDEYVTRYIFTKRHFSTVNNKLRYAAFIPPKSFPNEISVFRIINLNDDEIWQLGVDYVQNAGTRNKPLIARGDLSVFNVRHISYDYNNENQELNVVPEVSRHQRHANIINLPQNNKGLLKIVARQLADISSLQLKNSS